MPRAMKPGDAVALLGVQKNMQLSPCPDMPNCVCSHQEGEDCGMAAWEIAGSPKQVVATIKGMLAGEARVELQAEKPHYLHYTFRSRLWGFVDDVEFLVDERAMKVHFRSASRLGYADLGANRRRMERLTKQFRQAMAAQNLDRT